MPELAPHIKGGNAMSETDPRLGYYATVLRMRWGGLTKRQKRRLWKIDPLIEISLRHMIEDRLLP